MSFSEILDPTRVSKVTKAMKADRTLHRTTFTPSSAKGGETLYINVPRLNENMMFVPRSMFLRFDIEVDKGDADNHLVQNVSRNLVSNMKVIFGGKTIRDTERYDLFHGYHDMLTCEEDIKRGIMTEDRRKIREKGTGTTRVANLTFVAYDKKYHIPLSHPVLDDHGVYYQNGLNSNLRFELKLALSDSIVVTSDSTKDCGYELKNIELEYTTIENPRLAYKASSAYQNGRTFYFEDVHHFAMLPSLDIGSGYTFNLHVNTPRSCMKGIMLLFLKAFNKGERDSEKFINPLVNSIKVSIDGVPHKLYSDGMKREDVWTMLLKRFDYVEDHFKEIDFHNDKFALWIDLRSTPDNNLHGDGVVVVGSQDGVRLVVDLAGITSTTVNCHVFVVSDAAVLVSEGVVRDVRVQPSS